MLRYCRRKYIDVDDTAVRTTRDLRGDINRVDDYLTEAPGFGDFLRWSPEGNVLLSCYESTDELGRAFQEKKIGKFGLLDYFTKKRGGGIHILGSPDQKMEMLERLVRDSRLDRDEQAVIGDRPSCELGKAIQLGLQVYRMKLLDDSGEFEGKYKDEALDGPHVEVNTWCDLMQYPNLGPLTSFSQVSPYEVGARRA